MARKGAEPTLRDVSWAENWPDAPRYGSEFPHAGGFEVGALDVLRQKGWAPVDFRTLDGGERIEAMLKAVTNGVYDPSPGELKVIDLHMKHIKDKDESEDTGKQAEVLNFLDLLQDMASRETPEWAKSAKTDTPAPIVSPKEVGVTDIMKDLGLA